MQQLLPYLIMSQKDNSGSDNSHLLLMSMMNNPNMMQNPMSIAPFLFMNDGTSDLKSVFLAMTMMQNQVKISLKRSIEFIF